MSLKPWYKVVTPREDLREGKPLDTSEFAVHLDQVREGKAPADHQKSTDEGRTTFCDTTVLDRLHQSMILFATGPSAAMERILVEDGASHDRWFRRLSQALSVLYPSPSEEKRRVDGVLARKKGLGF